MCKKLVCLTSFVLLMALAGNASALIVSTYVITPSLHGGTTTADGVGLCDTGALRYLGTHWSGGCSGNDETGWIKYVVPDLSALEVPQTIVSVTMDNMVYSYNSGHPWPGLRVDRVANDSWTAATIHNGWAVSGDWLQERPTGAETEGLTGLRNTDISSWYGAGKESLTGGEALSLRLTAVDMGVGLGKQRLHSAYWKIYVTTVPEPVTIALLGLGSLALLRKRR